MTKKQMAIELLMPVVFALVSLYFIVEAVPMGSEGTFPLICGAIQLACSLYLLAKVIVRREVVVKTEGLRVGKALVTLAVLVGYVLVLEEIGYCISTFLLVAFIIRFLGYKNYRVILLCSALTVAATFVIFDVLLSVPLPVVFLS